jgi:hypothetical protein
MNYSKADVLRMLLQLRQEIERAAFYYKNDNIPPKVVLEADVKLAIERVVEEVAK